MSEWSLIELEQKIICERTGTAWDPVTPNSLIAFNTSLFTSIQPVNGLRHPKEGPIDGLYLWSGGDIPDDNLFFEPIMSNI